MDVKGNIMNQGAKISLITKRVDALFAKWDNSNSPGCAIAIIMDSKVVYSRGYGMADLEHNIPISTNSVFDVGSISKQFTALCVAVLARQGKCSLNDEIQKYLPEIRYYERPLTIRHLIYHTSGLRDYIHLMVLSGQILENEFPDEEIFSLIARQKALNFQPGDEFLYSNTGYLLLGEIIKRISGNSLRNFADEHIFSTLGMKSTFFHDDFSEIVKNRAYGYSPKEGGGYQIEMSLCDVVGDGGVFTTVEDLCLWDANFYNNVVGGYEQNLIQEITTPGRLNGDKQLEYAYGLYRGYYRGLKWIGHPGDWMGYAADIVRFPEQRLTVICLSNTNDALPYQLNKQIADIFLSNEFMDQDESISDDEYKFDELSPQELEEFNGYYRSTKSGEIWKLASMDKKLFLDFGMNLEFLPIAPNKFKSVDTNVDIIIEIAQQSPNNPNILHVEATGGSTYTLKKISSNIGDNYRLVDYAGDYYSEELDVTYKFSVENDVLLLSYRERPKEQLEPVAHDLFRGAQSTFEFNRNSYNHVIGFELNHVFVRGILFVKK
jgi:CubicO group peptidase (beta-lactamase class C family)